MEQVHHIAQRVRQRIAQLVFLHFTAEQLVHTVELAVQIALGSENILHRVVGVSGGGQVVVAGIQNVGARAVGVKAGQLTPVHRHGDGLTLAGLEQAGLAKAHQLHGGLFHAVFPVVVGVGGLCVDLHRLLAGHIAGVGDTNRHKVLIPVTVILHIEIGVFKAGVGQSVAEGERHHAVVIKVARVAGAHDGVLIAGLIVFVADVDALVINHVGAGIGGNFAALVPRIGDGSEVAHGGGGEVVVAVGIHQRT